MKRGGGEESAEGVQALNCQTTLEPGSSSQEGRGEDRQAEQRAGGWSNGLEADKPWIQGCDMKLPPSWTAMLPGSPRGRPLAVGTATQK